jgi:hypothetical protein
MFLNPLEVSQIRVENAVELSSSEVLVVYRSGAPSKGKGKKGKGDDIPDERPAEGVQRIIIAGPCEFMTTANDRIETFNWHGTDPQNKTRKIPGALKFQKLRVIPDQFYYNVVDVRTSDDALVTVKLMVFYELKKIEKMLDQTHDPIADFINSVCAGSVFFLFPFGGFFFGFFRFLSVSFGFFRFPFRFPFRFLSLLRRYCIRIFDALRDLHREDIVAQ